MFDDESILRIGEAAKAAGVLVVSVGLAEEIGALARGQPPVALLVKLDAAQAQHALSATALERARACGSMRPWIVVAPPKRMAEAQAAVSGLRPVAVMDAFALSFTYAEGLLGEKPRVAT